MFITNDIRYVGVNDHQVDLFEGQYVVPNGMSYNSYVILDEKVAVMDTVDQNFGAEWLANIRAELGDRKPDYLVVHHMEPDHSANIDVFLKAYPEAVVVSSQHSEDVSLEQIREDIIEHVIKPVLPAEFLDEDTKIYVNPTGRFVIGGPVGDSGLTGRKIIVDTYGGACGHGGGAFSGKDPTKVDRSASYAARWVAKNIVAAGLADKCEVELAYAIGVARPLSVFIDTFGTETVPLEKISAAVDQVFDLRPSAIIDALDLRRPIYKQVAAYGHMGREDLGVPWEATDRVDALKDAVAAM